MKDIQARIPISDFCLQKKATVTSKRKEWLLTVDKQLAEERLEELQEELEAEDRLNYLTWIRQQKRRNKQNDSINYRNNLA